MEKPFIIGREEEIQELLSDLKESKKTVRILHGEAGVGKSRVLDVFYETLKQNHDYKNTHFIGYYDKSKAVIVEASSSLYPFEECLLDLIKFIKESQNTQEQISSFLDRLKESAITFAKQEGKEIAIAVINDLIKKAGFEETASFGKRFISVFKGTKSSITKVEEYLSKNQEDVFRAYLAMFQGLATEYENRKFVLIFDQFESVGKHAIDFLLNLITLLPAERFHIIVGFQTKDRTWREPTIRALFEETRDKIVFDLGGKELELQGLTADGIGKWIRIKRNMLLPLYPDLDRIQERTAGLPLLLDTWIQKSQNLNYEEIDVNNHCQQLTRLSEDLDEQDSIKLDKLSILLNPLNDEEFISKYLNFKTDTIEGYYSFINRLIRVGIFDNKSDWFKHELLKSCYKDKIREMIKKKYNEQVANHYYSLIKKKLNIDNSSNVQYNQEYYKLEYGYAYHLHNAGKYSDSFNYNNKVAKIAFKLGNLDEAELCYKRCLDAATKDRNIDKYSANAIIFSLSHIYSIWGRYDEALSNLKELLNYYIQNKMEYEQVPTLNNIGIILKSKGEYDEAIMVYEESLEIARKIGDQQGIPYTLTNIGNIFKDKREYDKALKKI
jgi:tetratricopeptide (TPR) repeat protein